MKSTRSNEIALFLGRFENLCDSFAFVLTVYPLSCETLSLSFSWGKYRPSPSLLRLLQTLLTVLHNKQTIRKATRNKIMGKFDDSFGIGDLPTNDELGLVEEEEDSEHEQAPTSRRKRSSATPPSPPAATQPSSSPVVEGMAHHHDAVSTHGRWIVVLVLCLSAAGMGVTTFRYIARTEREEFEATVCNSSDKSFPFLLL